MTSLVCVGVGAAIDSLSGTQTLAYPASIVSGDWLLVWVQMKNTANTAPAPSSTLVWTAGQAQGGGSKTFSTFYDGSATAPTIATAGNALYAVMTAWRSTDGTTPILASTSGVNTSDAQMHYPALGVTLNNCAIQTFCVKNSAITSVTPASLPSTFTELVDHNCTSGAFGVHSQYLIQNTKADIPATTLAVVGGVNFATAQGIVIVIQPSVVVQSIIRNSSGTRRGSRQPQ